MCTICIFNQLICIHGNHAVSVSELNRAHPGHVRAHAAVAIAPEVGAHLHCVFHIVMAVKNVRDEVEQLCRYRRDVAWRA